MDLKCKNCGQFISDDDKFCRFCGCPTPKQDESPKKTADQLQAEIEEARVIIDEKRLDDALGVWNYDDIKIREKGTKSGIVARAYAVIAATLIVIIAAAVSVYLVKSANLPPIYGLIIIMLLVFAIFIALIFALESIFKIKHISNISDRQIIIPRYSMKKLPLFEIGGYIFEMDVDKTCPACDGEIKGDIHIEKIYDTLVAVCNYDRSHFYRINEAKFFEYYLDGVKDRFGAATDSADALQEISLAANETIPANSETAEINAAEIINKDVEAIEESDNLPFRAYESAKNTQNPDNK